MILFVMNHKMLGTATYPAAKIVAFQNPGFFVQPPGIEKEFTVRAMFGRIVVHVHILTALVMKLSVIYEHIGYVIAWEQELMRHKRGVKMFLFTVEVSPNTYLI